MIELEKKNTMENITKEQAVFDYSGWSRDALIYHIMTLENKLASGSVAAQKEEFSEVEKLEMQVRGSKRFNEILQIEINNLKSERDDLRQQLKEREEALKELLPIAERKFNGISIDDAASHREYIALKAIIERARKTLNKEF